MSVNARDAGPEIGSVEIILNGESRQVPEGTSVAGLLEQLGIEGDRIAVELNRAIVRRAAWQNQLLTAGAQLEIVHFVGGG